MSEQKKVNVAVLGATGAVGQKMIETLEDRDFPVKELKLLSSSRSAGSKISFKGEEYTVEEAKPESFENVDIALFSAGGSISKKLAPEAVKRGALVIDNTSAYRMDPEVPLVVPEVNEEDIKENKGIIANPNCSTIQMVAALKPIDDKYGLKRVLVSTYQAVSGAGNDAVDEMNEQSRAMLDGKEYETNILPVKGDEKHFPIAFNALPQIDVFEEDGYTFEEKKMINETKKIMHMDKLPVSATCVRLPFAVSHAESVYVEIDKEAVSVSDFRKVISNGEGLTLQDNPSEQDYPTPLSAAGKKDVFVGRIRKDPDVDYGFHMWVVSDNLLKGAAWNSIQIAERVVTNNWL
ncbi:MULTISPECIES: aspartate-semialdehyde dehydrogenase [Salimicrobium]|uniref:Aspartate-semialdehyde dehydrogenase n=3 Tax=Salimicrobium TaxID=351195 RepID=K2GCM5_9BACI|nr:MULTISPECIES: aspartate-semialdehyde dehydrogenase [Salimicrobium]AKG04537.1 aspartate-semialdehyde dehydrogenase [Salimicrobium jeotgali]EKE32748.1 aspartate-semialdehyde dehydrogenase [Salimicrobium jeotgali]MBM7695264.1 aspartate-semialdehyde dehydrogenase [Salimicrobium jeotgali]SDX30013.1 aspartate-semialdehyde dehydrogenase [Salimicrobium album]SIS64410.1 aspartate semialdehyde dehydrogenase [Salimicrobium salexigens]